MTTNNAIKEALERETLKHIRRHNRSNSSASEKFRRYERRSGLEAISGKGGLPSHWSVNQKFNPYYVRSRLPSLAHAISSKIRLHTYKPDPTLSIQIAKPAGGFREISISTLPDSAVSYWLGKRLIDRNIHRFSSYSYAYRPDRNAHHAIEHLMSRIRGSTRLFVLEYDFAKYFDTIRHDYLESVVDKYFSVTAREMTMLKTLLKNKRAKSVGEYSAGIFHENGVGIPQGTTISLFLANVACFELDREIEDVGVTFARYADDTLVVCDSYEKADRCAKLLISHGDRSGTAVNFEKSPGISLMTAGGVSELRSTPSVIYLSHELRPNGVRIPEKSIFRMKKRISKIIYNNLLLQVKRGAVNKNRIGDRFYDWDLVTCVNEIRRYVYGKISEDDINNGLKGKARISKTICSMSFYPTVSKSGGDQMKALDGWLADTLTRAYEKRCDLLESVEMSSVPLANEQIISGDWYTPCDGITVETQLPSFYKAWRYVRRAAEIYGLESFPSPVYGYGR